MMTSAARFRNDDLLVRMLCCVSDEDMESFPWNDLLEVSISAQYGVGVLLSMLFGCLAPLEHKDRFSSWSLSQSGDDECCVLCLESMKASQWIVETGCKHRFHRNCVVKCMFRCPVCRHDLYGSIVYSTMSNTDARSSEQ